MTLNCYVAKALPVKYQNTAHRLYTQTMHTDYAQTIHTDYHLHLLYKGADDPAVLPGNSLFKFTLAGCQRNQAVRKFACARGYCVKLQCGKYTERRTLQNNNNTNI